MANTVKPYRDAFGNPLTKQDVTTAVQVAVLNGKISSLSLATLTRLGVSKSARIIELLKDANIVSADNKVMFRGASSQATAINAALRQLNKGRSS